ncbi:nucleoside-diphosphate sugar epimerase/dehydratase [Wukongibacter baidiensis]|uniref:polysaccharide biosynthesis protein n=1 Tax=Wukongibacter baidiensis TaxID=1723361 RepID=UPI003D7F9F3A
MLVALDVALINIAAILAIFLKFDLRIPTEYFLIYRRYGFISLLAMLIVYRMFNLYKILWKYASIEELVTLSLAAITGTSILNVLYYFLKVNLPQSFYIIFAILNITFVGGIRFLYGALNEIRSYYIGNCTAKKRALIIGGGKAGSMVIKEMRNSRQTSSYPVGVIDDDISKHTRRINGVPILGTRLNIKKIVEKKKIDEIIIAIPSASKKDLKDIVDICKETKCKLRTLPGVYELIDGKVDIKRIRDVNMEDLLGREPVKVDLDEICGYIENQVILVTGGGGSIGSELCRQISKFKPKKLLILDIYENNAYILQNELKRKYEDLDLEVFIASIRDKKRMEQIFSRYRPNIVFHAAAHKHVPLMEANPTEAIKNNVFGTLNVAEMADAYGVKRFVLISTDKAVNPTNVMGATKRISEIIVQAMDRKSKTEYVAVRFGNVLGSNGSVLQIFKRQISEGGPVTVTDPEVIRHFMTIGEAVQLVLEAGAMAKGGEIFLLDMGEPIKILDLARNLIRLSGFEPDKEIKIEFIGLRAGEKLYEELLMDEEGRRETKNEKIFIGKPTFTDIEDLRKELKMFRLILAMEDELLIRTVIKKLVPTFRKVC